MKQFKTCLTKTNMLMILHTCHTPLTIITPLGLSRLACNVLVYFTQNQICYFAIISLYSNHTSTVSNNVTHIKRTFGFWVLGKGKGKEIFLDFYIYWLTQRIPNHDDFIHKTTNTFGLFSTHLFNTNITMIFFFLFFFSLFVFFLIFFYFFF